MRRLRADLEEKREPRAATSTRQNESEDGAYGQTDHHLTTAAIEKQSLRAGFRLHESGSMFRCRRLLQSPRSRVRLGLSRGGTLAHKHKDGRDA
jgi:hypothetical protein